MNNIDKIIVQSILHAQYWSTKAKHVSKAASIVLYKHKDECLAHAVALLKTAKNSRIQWRQVIQPDQNGNTSVVLYFEFNYVGKHYQFSFHNFNFKAFGRQPKGNPTIEWEGVRDKPRKNLTEIRRYENTKKEEI